ncbi:hypothetical protein BDZ89DRAFT_1011332 [Hymenopellis radicata]|nr:hypothetical protein BDZ89DRAFT_1011332 [Hymenopellis radicata]
MFRSFSLVALILSATTLVTAHFTLDFPEPRGVFVSDNQVDFCGGYNNAASNRSQFPLSGGFFTITSGHGDFTAGVLLSTAQNPTSFDNFKTAGGEDQVVRGWATEEDGGTFCIPLSLNNTGISGVESGANVTIQVQFDGGDGALYQCADLTLSNNFTITETCTNATSSSSGNGSNAAVSLHLASATTVGLLSAVMSLFVGL